MNCKQNRKQLSVLDPLVAGVQYFVCKGNSGRFKLWYDPILEKEYEEYSVNGFSSNNEFDIYQFRRDQWHNLIGVNHLSQVDNLGLQQLKVFTQRIPIFLSELTILTLSQSLLILKQSLIGFQTIMEKYGLAHIEDRMIGINSQGKIKVWWNSKYEKNHAEIPIVTVNWLNSSQLQQQMVNSLFVSIEKHCEKGEQFLRFQKSKPQNMNFIKSRDYLFDFINQQRITLPQTLKYFIFPSYSFTRIKPVNHPRMVNFIDNSLQNSQNSKNYIIPNFSQSHEYVSTKIKSQPNQLLSSKKISRTPSFIYTRQGDYQSQQKMNSKNKTKYFKQGSNLSRRDSIRSGSKSKDKINIKSSWTSKDLSFKSTTNSNQRKTIQKSLFQDRSLNTQQNKQLFQQQNNESFMNESQYQFHSKAQPERARSQHYQFPIDRFPITKSVMINNNQQQKQIILNPQNIMTRSERKPLQIETGFKLNRDFNAQNMPNILVTPTKSRNLSSLTQFKAIKRSVIKHDQKKDVFNKNGLLAISQLKSSYFNKLDDIKRSIISQHMNQNCQDVSSPLLIKTRSSSIRKGFMRNMHQIQQDILPVLISSQTNLLQPVVYSSTTKSTILREIIEADGQ